MTIICDRIKSTRSQSSSEDKLGTFVVKVDDLSHIFFRMLLSCPWACLYLT